MKPMLSSPAKDIRFPVYASPKIDGIRAYVKDGKLLSRTGKLIPNKYVQRTLGIGVLDGLDGELCVGPPYAQNLMQLTTSGVMSFDGEPNFTYWVFDIWGNTKTFEKRYEQLCFDVTGSYPRIKELVDAGQLKFIIQTYIRDTKELIAYEQICITEGYEGIMIRDPEGKYKYGRSTAKGGELLKIKRWEDSEATILSFNEFMHNANELQEDNFGYAKRSSHQAGKIPMNTLGSLVCRDIHSNQLVDIGTGFTQELRKEIWNNRDSVKKQIVKYKHFANAGVKDAPRFPVFIGFRHPEDM